MGTVTVPTWAVPDELQVRDLRAVAAGHNDPRAHGVVDAVDWATGWPVTWDQAGQEMTEALAERKANPHRGGVADTIAWLMGFAAPPLELPRRNPGGTAVTAEQLYAEMLAEHPLPPTPEERRAMRDSAARKAARWDVLAEQG